MMAEKEEKCLFQVIAAVRKDINFCDENFADLLIAAKEQARKEEREKWEERLDKYLQWQLIQYSEINKIYGENFILNRFIDFFPELKDKVEWFRDLNNFDKFVKEHKELLGKGK